jgi:Transposase, Mutator family
MEDAATTNPIEWKRRHLCCDYLLVLFETVGIEVREECGVECDRALLCALGVLDDGQFEAAGVWPLPSLSAPSCQEVLEDLAIRGVEKIRYVSGEESAELHSAISATYPRATLVSRFRQPETHSALPLRHRRAGLASEAIMRQLRNYASRAIGRHGCFSDATEAVAFVTAALGRAEQRIDGAAGVGVPSKHLLTSAGGRSHAIRTQVADL